VTFPHKSADELHCGYFADRFAVGSIKPFATIRPIFRERGKINAEVTGRLRRKSLGGGGVRVSRDYHAEEREEGNFASRRAPALDNVMRTRTAHFGYGPRRPRVAAPGRGAGHNVCGRIRLQPHVTVGGSSLHCCSAPGRSIMQNVSIGTRLTSIGDWSARRDQREKARGSGHAGAQSRCHDNSRHGEFETKL